MVLGCCLSEPIAVAEVCVCGKGKGSSTRWGQRAGVACQHMQLHIFEVCFRREFKGWIQRVTGKVSVVDLLKETMASLSRHVGHGYGKPIFRSLSCLAWLFQIWVEGCPWSGSDIDRRGIPIQLPGKFYIFHPALALSCGYTRVFITLHG